MTWAERFPVQGQLLTGELVIGLLVLRYDCQRIEGFPHPVGAGMTNWCELRIEDSAAEPRLLHRHRGLRASG